MKEEGSAIRVKSFKGKGEKKHQIEENKVRETVETQCEYNNYGKRKHRKGNSMGSKNTKNTRKEREIRYIFVDEIAKWEYKDFVVPCNS